MRDMPTCATFVASKPSLLDEKINEFLTVLRDQYPEEDYDISYSFEYAGPAVCNTGISINMVYSTQIFYWVTEVEVE